MINVLLIVGLILMIWFGWAVGFARTFVAVLAGFTAVFIATKYPYQEGLNFYLIFVITGLFVVMLGNFVLKLTSFLKLNILNRIGGAILGACVWFIVSANAVVPTITNKVCV